MTRFRFLLPVLFAFSLVLTPAWADAAGAPPWQTVAAGLDNPRGIAFLPNGRLVVAESGHSGTTCVAGGSICLGLTARITELSLGTGSRRILARGLPSLGLPFESFGLGAVAVRGEQVYALTTENPQVFGSPAAACASLPRPCRRVVSTAKSRAGLLVRTRPGGGYERLAGVGAADYRYTVSANPSPGNPDFTPGDANPYGLLVDASGTAYIADGGANTLSVVRPDGLVRVLAYVPDPPRHQPLYDAVPTCVARAGDALYIGTLTGSLFRWRAGQLTRVLHGGKLSAVVSCTSDSAGNLYMVNLTTDFGGFMPKPGSGSVVRIDRHLRTSYVVAPDQGLNYPGGIAFGPDGAVFLSVNSVCPRQVSLIAGLGLPPGSCPAGGRIVRLSR